MIAATTPFHAQRTHFYPSNSDIYLSNSLLVTTTPMPRAPRRESDSQRFTPVTGRPSRAKKGLPVHTCNICAKTFTRNEHLKRHQLNHKDAALPCPEEGCDKVFKRQDLLTRHLSKSHQTGQENQPVFSSPETARDRRHSRGSSISSLPRQSDRSAAQTINTGLSTPGSGLEGPNSSLAITAQQQLQQLRTSNAGMQNLSAPYQVAQMSPTMYRGYVAQQQQQMGYRQSMSSNPSPALQSSELPGQMYDNVAVPFTEPPAGYVCTPVTSSMRTFQFPVQGRNQDYSQLPVSQSFSQPEQITYTQTQTAYNVRMTSQPPSPPNIRNSTFQPMPMPQQLQRPQSQQQLMSTHIQIPPSSDPLPMYTSTIQAFEFRPATPQQGYTSDTSASQWSTPLSGQISAGLQVWPVTSGGNGGVRGRSESCPDVEWSCGSYGMGGGGHQRAVGLGILQMADEMELQGRRWQEGWNF